MTELRPGSREGVSGLRPLIVINSLWQGGAEQSTADMVLHLHERGMVPEVVCLRRGVMPLADELRAAGIRVTHLDPDLSHRRTIATLRRHIREHRADLVHLTLYESVVLGSLAAIGTGVPVLTSVVSTPQHLDPEGIAHAGTAAHLGLKRRAFLLSESLVYRNADRVHAVTHGVARCIAEVQGVSPDRISVVERGRDPARFPPATAAGRATTRAALGLTDDDRLVLCVARHERDKGLERLVPGFDHLDRADVHVLVAGRDGVTTPDLVASIATARHPERFELLGERTDVPALLGAADVFLLPSRREGAAGAALEAMAVGAPIVSVPLVGLEGVITDGVEGRIARLDPPTALGDVTVSVLDDPEVASQMAARARELFDRRFTLEGAATRMGELYLRVAAEGRRSRRSRLGGRRAHH